jgi:hypothetical protein
VNYFLLLAEQVILQSDLESTEPGTSGGTSRVSARKFQILQSGFNTSPVEVQKFVSRKSKLSIKTSLDKSCERTPRSNKMVIGLNEGEAHEINIVQYCCINCTPRS